MEPKAPRTRIEARTRLVNAFVMRSLRYPALSVRYVGIEAGLSGARHCQVLQGTVRVRAPSG